LLLETSTDTDQDPGTSGGTDGHDPPPPSPTKCEQFLAHLLGSPGAYFASGHGVDETNGVDREGKDPGHLYGSATNPNIAAEFYAPPGGRLLQTAFYNDKTQNSGKAREITGNNPYVAYGKSSEATASFIYYKQLGPVRDVTLVVFHIAGVSPKGLVSNSQGRQFLGIGGGFDEGGSWHFRDENGQWIEGTHLHIELWAGYHNAFISGADKKRMLIDIRRLCPEGDK
jgi:hypothetical protein